MKSKIQNPKSKILIVFILLVAAFLRFYRLPNLPPGLNFDEAGNGVAALDILNGSPQIWWRIGGGKEPLWPYLIALSTIILGRIPFALRFPAALAGILTVAAAYPLMRTLFRNRQGYAIAWLTMLGLALSGWHLHFSRLGFRAILLPLLSTLAFYFLWRGLTVSRFTLHVLRFTLPIPNPGISALLLALAIYSYLAARFLPLILILFFALDWLIHRFYIWRGKINGKQQQTNNQLPITNYQLLSIIPLFIYLLLFLSPLILYFAFNPSDFIARSTTVSIFNPAWNNGDLIGTAWHTLTLSLSTFFGLSGDSNPLVNLPNQPALPPFLAFFFLIGLATSLYCAFHSYPCKRGNAPLPPHPHLFLLCWWTIMLLPAILAPEGAPHHLRLIGTVIPTYAFVAIGMVTAMDTINKLLIRTSRNTHPTPHTSNPKSKTCAECNRSIQNPKSKIAYLLPAICYLLLALQTYTNYFIRWPNAVDFTLPFDLYATRLAADIAQTPPNVAYILPMDIRAAAEARHYTLDYLLTPYQSKIQNRKSKIENPRYTYIPVDEHNAQTLLSKATAGKDELRVVRWTDDKHREADAKEIVTYLLETNAQFTDRQSFPAYDIETYALSGNKSPGFTLPSINHPIGVTFDDLLRLNAAFVQPTTSPGNWLPVALTLAPVAPMDTDYKASLRLINSSGERLAQKDRTLMHNFHQGTSLWPVETVNEYYLLPVSPETPPGDYAVVVVIYHPDTLTPLVANGVVEVSLGTTKIK